MAKNQVNRCKTGVTGFDNLCEGGLVSGSINAVLGGPGAGKTTFLLQFLWNGVTKFNENGLYISFEQDAFEIFEDANSFGWDFAKYDQNGKCKFVKMSPKNSIKDIKDELTKLVSKYDVKRIAIDPISILSMSIEREVQVREMVFDLMSLLKRMKVTVILADETTDSTSVDYGIGVGDTRTQFIKFLCDSVIAFYSSGLGGTSDRALRIGKMRRTNQVRGPIPFEITNDGIKVSGKK